MDAASLLLLRILKLVHKIYQEQGISESLDSDKFHKLIKQCYDFDQ